MIQYIHRLIIMDVLLSFNATSNIISVIQRQSFLWMEPWRNPGNSEKITELDNRNYYVMLYQEHLCIGRNKTHKRQYTCALFDTDITFLQL